jgi:hypothetical protein
MNMFWSKNAQENQTIIFIHIPKTAGSTLNSIIDRQYPLGNICSIYPENATVPGGIELSSTDELKELNKTDQAKIHFLRTHMSFGIHRLLPGPSTYFTVLRDPIERIISLYYFVSALPTPLRPDYFPSEDISLQNWLRNKITIDMDNAQTRMLSGNLHTVPFGRCTREDLERAKRNLQEHFSVVGLTERFNETLILLKRVLGWEESISYTRQNVTRKRPQKDDLSPATLNAIAEANFLDIELYRYAEELFEKQVHRQGITFAVETKMFEINQHFRHICQKLQRKLGQTPSHQDIYKAHITVEKLPPTIRLGEKFMVRASVTNTGEAYWPGPKHKLENRIVFGARLYLPNNQLYLSQGLKRKAIDQDLAPGEQIEIEYTLQLPEGLDTGNYILRFDMIRENIAWFEQFGSPIVEHSFTLVE